MTLYELTDEVNALRRLVDEEELPDGWWEDTLESLTGEINEKADNIGCLLKEIAYECDALRAEKARIEDRIGRKEKRYQSLKEYLSRELMKAQINKVETPRNVITFRRSESLNIDNEDRFILWAQKERDDLLKFSLPKIDKMAVKKALKNGESINGAAIEEKYNIQIK